MYQGMTLVELLNLSDKLDALFVEEDEQGSPMAAHTMNAWEDVQEAIEQRLDTSV